MQQEERSQGAAAGATDQVRAQEEANRAAADAQAENRTLKSRIRELEENIVIAKKKATCTVDQVRAQEEANRAAAENRTLKSRIRELEEEISTAKKQAPCPDGWFQKVEADTNRAAAENRSLKSRIRELEEEISIGKKHAPDGRLEKAEAALQEQTAKNIELTAKLEQVTELAGTAKLDAVAQKSRADKLSEELERVKAYLLETVRKVPRVCLSLPRIHHTPLCFRRLRLAL